MKNINKLKLAAVVAVAFISINIVNAGPPLHSPRGKANQIKIVPRTSANDVNLAKDRPAGNAKMWALQRDFRKVPVTTVDVAHGPRPAMSPKDPRYDQALRGLRAIQIAPLK